MLLLNMIIVKLSWNNASWRLQLKQNPWINNLAARSTADFRDLYVIVKNQFACGENKWSFYFCPQFLFLHAV